MLYTLFENKHSFFFNLFTFPRMFLNCDWIFISLHGIFTGNIIHVALSIKLVINYHHKNINEIRHVAIFIQILDILLKYELELTTEGLFYIMLASFSSIKKIKKRNINNFIGHFMHKCKVYIYFLTTIFINLMRKTRLYFTS